MEVDLAEVAKQLLGEVQRAGPNNVMARCPLHLNKHGVRETNPSFGLNIQNGLWNCYSCGEKGNLKQLLYKLNVGGDLGLASNWKDILEELKARAPVRVPRTGYWLKPFPEEKVLPEHVLGLFRHAPQQMLVWGFRKAVLRAYDIGYDSKNCRITFPLRDFTGQLVGFSGRDLLNLGGPRYKVYGKREYELWGLPALDHPPKGELLWGYHQAVAVTSTRPGLPIVLTEGFKAHLWLVQAGYPVTLALLGSAMTEEHQHLLERLGGTIYVFLDNDAAGQKKYQIAERLSRTHDVRIPIYPTTQPDQLPPEEVRAAIENAPSYLTWRFQNPPDINPYTYRPPRKPQHHDE